MVTTIDSQEVPETRTFEQILDEDYRNSLRKFCAENTIDYRTAHYLLHGGITRSSAYKTIQAITSALRADCDVLFPSELYPKSLFSSIIDTPGYSALLQKYPLHFRDQTKRNLHNLFFDLQLTPADYSMFIGALLGHMAVWARRPFCERIAATLQIPLVELFPPNVYNYAKWDVSNDVHADPLISEEPVAKKYLSHAFYHHDWDRCGDIRAGVLEQLSQYLDVLPEAQRVVVQRYFGFRGSPETLEDIGSDLGITRAAAHLRKNKALVKLRNLLGEALSDIEEYEQKSEKGDRDRIIM